MNFTLQNFFQDSELQVEFNSKLGASKFNSFVKMFKIFRLRTNANQNLILSALVEKSLKSENKDSIFLFCKTFEAVNLGVSRSTLERFFEKLTKLGIVVKVASKEIEAEKKINAYAFNADKLQEFIASELKFNAYYKSVFGNNDKKQKSSVSEKDKIQYLENLVEALREEVKIRDEKIMELQKGEAIYNEAEVEALEVQNTKLREKLQEMIEAYERLGEKHKELGERYAKLESAESNRLLESTASRLADENEELKRKIESKELENRNVETESEREKDKKIQELESSLEKAREIFKSQESRIKSLLMGEGVDVVEIEARIKKDTEAKANAILQEYGVKTKARMKEQKDEIDRLINERESFVKEITELKELEVTQLKEKVAKLESENLANKNAKGVPFTLEQFVDKVMPQIVHHLNPTQKAEVENTFKRMARLLTECYEKDPNKEPERAIKEIIDIEAEAEAEAEATFPYIEPTNELPASEQEDSGFKAAAESMQKNDKENLTPPTWTQEDLPF